MESGMLKKTLGPALCGALLLALAGCSGDKDLEKPVEAPEIANSIDVQEIWSHSLGSSDSAEFYSRLAPAVSGGTVFAAGRDGDVYAMDLASGDTRWSVDLSDEEENDDRRSARLSGGVAASRLKAAVGSENGWIYVMNAADGKLSWKQYVGAEVVSVPAFSQDGARLFVLDSRGLVTAYDSATGAQLWQGGDSSGTLRLRSQPRPVAVGNKALLLGTRSGKVLILSQSDGGLLNSVTVGTPAGSNDLERVADVAGTPLLLGSELYTSAYNSGFVWYSFNDRAVVNRLGYHSSRDLAFDGSRFVIVGDDGHISCISRQDGHELWQNAQLTNRNVSSPAIYGEYAVVGDMEGYVYFLDLGTGRIVFMDSTDDSPVTAAPLVTANGVLVQTSGSDLYLFRHAQSAASSKLAEANAELASAGAGVNFAADGYDVSGGEVTREMLQQRRAQAQELVSRMEAQQRAMEARRAEYERQRAEYLEARKRAEEEHRQSLAGFGLMPGVKSEGSGEESGKVQSVEQEQASGSQGASESGQSDENSQDKASGFGIY